MKQLFTTIAAVMFAINLFGQTYSENFDSYNVGDYIGKVSDKWSTWSGATGGAEDAKITNAQSKSNPNSIYFNTTAASGGPQDVVVNFGGPYNVGQFTFGSSFFVEANNGAYFNFQANATIGEQWALDCYMVNDGNLYLVSDGALVFAGTYPIGKWFDLKIDMNLSINKWEIYIDDVLKGTWSNPINQIASIDIYPVNPESNGGNNNCSFYVDNFYYDVKEYTLPDLNAAVILVSPINGLVSQERNVVATVRNLGKNAITSFDLTYEYNGESHKESVSGVNIASLGQHVYKFTTPLVLAEGNLPCKVTISNVNGGTDGDANDDVKSTSINPIVPAPGKVVFSEEATGTWCGWCPRGAVAMDMMANKYHGFWAGVAVHNGDPMAVSAYDAGMGKLISGYPSALVDRGAAMDPGAMEVEFLKRITQAPAAVISNGARLDTETGNISIQAMVDWKKAISGDWKVVCIIAEDSVTGTDAGYNQANYYAGGSKGEMGGFEKLPNPVPAKDMVYNHVARALLTDFSGKLLNNVNGAKEGDMKVVEFNGTLKASWDKEQLSIIVLLISPDGKIDNAGYATLEDALIIGESSVVVTSEKDFIDVEGTLQMIAKVYPEDASDLTVSWSVFTNTQASCTIDSEGILKGVKEGGYVTVVAKANFDSSVVGMKDIMVVRLVKSIEITSPQNVDSVGINKTLQLSATVLPENATEKGVIWTLSSAADSAKATIVNGLLTGVAEGNITVVATAKDGSGASDAFAVKVYKPIGVADNSSIALEIYPNPTSSVLNINISLNKFDYKIFNVIGQPMIFGNDNKTINVEQLRSGIYFIELKAGDMSKVIRFVKE